MAYIDERQRQQILEEEKLRFELRKQIELEKKTVVITRYKLEGFVNGLGNSVLFFGFGSFGIVLCFTGVGAIIGIPLILGSLILIFSSPIQGYLGYGKYICPFCAVKNTIQDKSHCKKIKTCKSCKNEILAKYQA